MQKNQSISPKHKFYGLLVAFALLWAFAYHFSIKETIEQVGLYRQNNQNLEQAANAPQRINEYQNQLNQLNAKQQYQVYDRANLFEQVNTFCRLHSLSLNNFSPEEIQQQGEFQIFTNQITVQGKYVDMIKLAYAMEFEQSLGHLAAATFEQKKDLRSRKTYLEGSLFLQNLVRN